MWEAPRCNIWQHFFVNVFQAFGVKMSCRPREAHQVAPSVSLVSIDDECSNITDCPALDRCSSLVRAALFRRRGYSVCET